MSTSEPVRASSAQDRRDRLVSMVEQQGYCTITELSDALRVSDMTVRRDVQLLERSGTLRSVHGGVTGLPTSAINGTDFSARSSRMHPAKVAVARRAIELLPAQGAVALDAGTTTAEVAAQLPRDAGLKIVTASLPIVTSLSGRDDLEVICLGGSFHPNSQSFAGPMTIAAIEEIRVRTFFLAASGLTGDAVYCGNHFDALSKRALVAVADEVVLLADSSKFSISAMVRACSLDDVDRIVIDDGLTAEQRHALEEHDVEVVIVDPEAAG